ncbi:MULTISPECIES: Rieske (2Fe-2S) protein [Flavobacterium]|uniref:Rieske (2Fe-2S) protein n=1 Tax=Flavobacterium suzhouense TaxID=1529638 RepID=A0ABW5NUR1_9FLAO|nr:hypothetical protein [Flavobacterium sp. AG291]RDI04609.1 hypothetical protein DEU42_11913 [Flavobacterium sp. AG291]
MKKYILLFGLLMVAIMASCDDDNFNNNNKYLPNYSFQVPVDMSSPLYSQLKFAGNAVYVSTVTSGINGIFVTNTGTGFTAFEASCPNQPLDTCSRLTLNGIMATCPCDNVEYFLYTGQPTGGVKVQYGLKPYRVQQISENELLISN